MAESKPAVLAATQLGKRYVRASGAEVWAVRDVSLEVETGELCALIGPSGSGKSTLLALLGALEVPTHGEVAHFGRSLSGASDHELARARRKVGFLLQGSTLLPRLPLWENVAYPLIPRGIPAAGRYRRAEALLGALGLSGLERSRPEELSGGERQRTALARALIAEPGIVLADEPTSSLDTDTGALVIRYLRDLCRQGVAVIVATHDPALIEVADRAVELFQGRPRAEG